MTVVEFIKQTNELVTYIVERKLHENDEQMADAVSVIETLRLRAANIFYARASESPIFDRNISLTRIGYAKAIVCIISQQRQFEPLFNFMLEYMGNDWAHINKTVVLDMLRNAHIKKDGLLDIGTGSWNKTLEVVNYLIEAVNKQ